MLFDKVKDVLLRERIDGVKNSITLYLSDKKNQGGITFTNLLDYLSTTNHRIEGNNMLLSSDVNVMWMGISKELDMALIELALQNHIKFVSCDPSRYAEEVPLKKLTVSRLNQPEFEGKYYWQPVLIHVGAFRPAN